MTRPCLTERLLMGRKESNQTNKYMFFLFSACSCDPMGTLEADGCDMETGSCTCKRYVTGQNCDRCYVSTICLYWQVPENSQLTALTSIEGTDESVCVYVQTCWSLHCSQTQKHGCR